jgi:endonuclease/exonuclease/phosphatase family metal-dependent hydrolase
MQLSLLHLNIWEGAFIDHIIEYIKRNDFDILHFQEVNSGSMSRGGYYNQKIKAGTPLNSKTAGIDCYSVLKDALPEYHSHQVITWRYQENPNSYVSNATFFKPSFTCIRQEIIRHTNNTQITENTFFPIEDHPRASLAVLLESNNKKIWSINTHLAWGPTPEDADYKMVQAERLYNFIEKLDKPFILSGDFNMTPDTQVVKMFEKLGRNLTATDNITNTLNPRIHGVKALFPPGLAVDYIFVSPEIKAEKFVVMEEDLSDHLGLFAQLHF